MCLSAVVGCSSLLSRVKPLAKGWFQLALVSWPSCRQQASLFMHGHGRAAFPFLLRILLLFQILGHRCRIFQSIKDPPLDSNLSMSQHISNTCKAAYIQIRHISSMRHLLTTQATQTLVCSLVLSRLDYCNSLLSGCPQYLLDKLQKVQIAAARLVCKAKKSDHIHPILETLHWLPVTHRIQYKISTICFNSISGTAPQYLSDLLQPYTPARQLRSASDTRTFVTPRVNTKTFGERSFSYAGPSVWNNLPQTLRHSDSTSSFKAALKTHLFNNYF